MTAGDEEENSPLADEAAPPPKRKGPQRRATISRKPAVDLAGDEIESDEPEQQEDDVDLKPAKRRKNVAENKSGQKAKTMQKPKKVDPTNVSVLGSIK